MLSESFETDGSTLNGGTRYTPSQECKISSDPLDFFTRSDGSDLGSSSGSNVYAVTGQDGNFFWAGMDIDGDPCSGKTKSITFKTVNIIGVTNLSFSGLFAEDDSGDGKEDWDRPERVFVEYQVDGGAWVKILQFANSGTNFNGEPRLDTDLDGIGDGTALTPTFTEFTAPISGSGNELTLRITLEDLDSGDEDVAFDLIKVTGVLPVICKDTRAPEAICVGNYDLFLTKMAMQPSSLSIWITGALTTVVLLVSWYSLLPKPRLPVPT